MIHPKVSILLSFILFLSSCYKDDPEPTGPSYLIAGQDPFGKTYRISRIDIEIGTVTPHQCVQDNFITYFPNGRYEVNEGASKCNPTDPPALVGSWEVDSQGKQITVELDGLVQTWMIESINKSGHEISSQFDEGTRVYSMVSTGG